MDFTYTFLPCFIASFIFQWRLDKKIKLNSNSKPHISGPTKNRASFERYIKDINYYKKSLRFLFPVKKVMGYFGTLIWKKLKATQHIRNWTSGMKSSDTWERWNSPKTALAYWFSGKRGHQGRAQNQHPDLKRYAWEFEEAKVAGVLRGETVELLLPTATRSPWVFSILISACDTVHLLSPGKESFKTVPRMHTVLGIVPIPKSQGGTP